MRILSDCLSFRFPRFSESLASFVTSSLWLPRLPISVKILRVLGEGGFSFVYLCQDETSGVSLAFWPSVPFLVVILTIISSEGVCLEKDKVSDWIRRCKAGYEGSGGLQEVQVCLFLRFLSTGCSNQSPDGNLGTRISFAFS